MDNANTPPVGRMYTQGAASCPVCQVLPWGEIRFCMLHAAAPALLEALERIVNSTDMGGEYGPDFWRLILAGQAVIAQAKGQ